jgi:hypothetical protein
MDDASGTNVKPNVHKNYLVTSQGSFLCFRLGRPTLKLIISVHWMTRLVLESGSIKRHSEEQGVVIINRLIYS